MSLTFRENHMAFAAKKFEDFITIPNDEPEQDSMYGLLKSQRSIGSRALPPMTMGKSPLDRVKQESGYLSPLIRSLTSSPVGSCHSRDGSPFSKRLTIRNQVSLTRKKLMDSLDSPVGTPNSTSRKRMVESGDSVDPRMDSAEELRNFMAPWTEGGTQPAAQERCFTSTAKSRVHMIKSISSQRALMGGDCIYSMPQDGTKAPTVSLDENDGADDAIDCSLKKNMYDEMRLDEFLMEHHTEVPLDVDEEELLDTISDCTDEDGDRLDCA